MKTELLLAVRWARQRTSCMLHTNNIPPQCFPNLFARRPLLASKNNQGSSHPYSRKYRCPDDKYPEFWIHISEVISDNYEYIPVARVTMHCMNWPYIPTVARFVGTGGFLIRRTGHSIIVLTTAFRWAIFCGFSM